MSTNETCDATRTETNGSLTPGSALREYVRGGRSKVDRYQWKILDNPGELRWIAKELLKIDESYQRAESEDKVLALAAAWSWIACGALIVAIRDGAYYVIDGNHRTQAARKRADIRTLPCLMFPTVDAKTEAQGFLLANTNRRGMMSTEKFKALLVTEDEVAVRVAAMVESSGYRIGKTHGKERFTTASVAALQQLYRLDPANLETAWGLAVAIANGEPITKKLVVTLAYVEGRIQPESLTSRVWRDKLMRVGQAGIVRAADQAIIFRGHSGAAVWAEGLVNLINKGNRSNMLKLNA